MEGLGFYIGRFFVAYYGLFIVLGIGVASLFSYHQIRRYCLNGDSFILLALFGGGGGMLGAKLLFLLLSYREIAPERLLDPDYVLALFQGGFVFYGGLLGGLFGLWISGRLFSIDLAPYIRYCTPAIPLVHAFGRLGCFRVGCCYGMPVNHRFSVVYTHSFFAPNHQPLFPVQLVEAFLLFAIALFLLCYINYRDGKQGLALYLSFYAVLRFVLEFFRGDTQRGIWHSFSTSQYISLGFLLCTFLWYGLRHRLRKEKRKAEFSK